MHDLLSKGVYLTGPTAFAMIAAGAHLAAAGRAWDAGLVSMQTNIGAAQHAASNTISAFDRTNKQLRDAFKNLESSQRQLTACVSALNDLDGMSARSSSLARPKPVEPIPDLIQLNDHSDRTTAGADAQLQDLQDESA
ncbi:hypothetical protein [Rhodococcus opacus]|uniref:hypothetical protein n=1 Tax=Rhodococcus opacus TaxID=37919 RepID=UPI00080B3FFF|nr:hypothetical protein [Rhodococcus opacus]